MAPDLQLNPTESLRRVDVADRKTGPPRLRRLATELTGVAGEFYVAAQLAHRGWYPALLPPGMSHLDLFARGPGGRQIAIQVKATASGSCAMGVTRTPPTVAGESDWMIMVDLDPTEPDRMAGFFVVPLVIAELFAWLGYEAAELRRADSGKTPARLRQDSGTTWLKPRDFEPYRNRWDLLDRDARSVPFDFSGGFDRWLAAVGIPASHDAHFRRGTP